jgi:hypothetical protein
VPTTTAFADSTVRRRGLATKLVRIIPVAYSEVTAVTASATTAIWLR